ncbi:unnamed protein product [Plutella xylostella]|uniref:(diamondback moth) hypothetical protein n=1 Tax=Plutella xylostella TaxID=51655 RepID=A0A8S4FIM5_PLUXY|nr:unnamed protein product [Plutella xylostella]
MGSYGVTLADLPNIFIMIAALVSLFIVLVIFLRHNRRKCAHDASGITSLHSQGDPLHQTQTPAVSNANGTKL